MIDRLVIFGASGDLTRRFLMPAIAQLAEADLLPPNLSVVGAANSEWSTREFRERVRGGFAEFAAGVDASARESVLRRLHYVSADVTEPGDVREAVGDLEGPALVYLALPTFLLEPAISALSTARLRSTDAVAIEKPFGTGLDSARRLNELLREELAAPTLFRVDHFLSDELVRQVLVLRFANRVFEPTWNALHIERVDISWLESLTLEGRAGYYDKAGALRDMVQNHLMEALALVVMEEPARIDPISFRDMRVEALRRVATLGAEEARGRSVRARYGEGAIGAREVPAYIREPGVDPGRDTETYASITLDVESARWAGVPFTLRSGKAMPEDRAEIAVHFRPVPRYSRERYPGLAPNVLRLGLMEPTIRLATTTLGGDRRATSGELELCALTRRRSPYANLLLDMLRGDATLSIRGDEAEEAWRVVDPIAEAWASGEVPMQTYAAGTEPPGAARNRWGAPT